MVYGSGFTVQGFLDSWTDVGYWETLGRDLSGYGPLSSEHGTHKTVKARFWSWLSGKSPQLLLIRSLCAR